MTALTKIRVHMLAGLLLSVSATWAQTLTVLHSFKCPPEGCSPQGDLWRDGAGNLYGTAAQGPNGEVFKVTAAGKEGTRLRWRVEACNQPAACIGRGYARRKVRVATNARCALYQRGVHAHRGRQFLFSERGRKAENAVRDQPGVREVGDC